MSGPGEGTKSLLGTRPPEVADDRELIVEA